MKEETKQIKYTKGYKYMLEEDAWFFTGIKVALEAKRVIHYADGWMLIKEGFGFDGASGITVDDKFNMRAALAHDGGYYLERHGFPQEYRATFDCMLRKLMMEDAGYLLKGKRFARLRRWFFIKVRPFYYKVAVKEFGKSAADPKNKKEILVAP